MFLVILSDPDEGDLLIGAGANEEEAKEVLIAYVRSRMRETLAEAREVDVDRAMAALATSDKIDEQMGEVDRCLKTRFLQMMKGCKVQRIG